MYKASRELSSIRPEELDQYLSRGWFRMDQTIFTSQYLQDEDFVFRDMIWLRHRLSAFQFPKWFWKMKGDAQFSVYIDDAHPSASHEFLYQQYRESKPESWPISLEDVLFGEKTGNVFNTKMINIWCGEELVAAGFFDLGKTSAAGIVNFYNPRFSKYSLGKYLYYLTVEHAINQGLEFFYPGYFAPGNLHLNYKLTMDRHSLEYFHSVYEAWYPFRMFKAENLLLPLMKQKLADLYHTLEDLGLQAYMITNANYQFAYNSKWDSPYAVYIVPSDPTAAHYAVTYDVNVRRYYIFDCTAQNWIDELKVVDNNLVCYERLALSKPLADEYYFSNAVKRLHELIEY